MTAPSLFDFYNRFWNPVLLCCSRMERRGVRLDVPRIKLALADALVAQAEARTIALTWVKSKGLAEFNPNSDKQIASFLYDTLSWPLPPVEGTLAAIKRRKPDKRPVGEAALAWLATNVASDDDKIGLAGLQRYNKVTRQVEFLEKLPACLSSDGRLRSSFAPDAETGRLASKKPSLHNVSSVNDIFGIRSCFVPRPGYVLGVFDFKALEIYIMAYFLVELYGDWSLYEALNSGDVYGAQAVKIWSERLCGVDPRTLKDHPDPEIRYWRKPAKALVLGTNYGKTPGGIALQLGVSDAVGREYYDAYFRANPSIARFQADSLELVRIHGYVRTLLGRLRFIDLPANTTEYASGNAGWQAVRKQKSAEARAGRQGTNTRVQGSAADWVYGCMLATEVDPDYAEYNRELADLGAELDLQVHDELVFEFPERTADRCHAIVIDKMIHPFPKFKLAFDLVIDGKCVDRWSEAKG